MFESKPSEDTKRTTSTKENSNIYLNICELSDFKDIFSKFPKLNQNKSTKIKRLTNPKPFQIWNQNKKKLRSKTKMLNYDKKSGLE